MRSSLSPSLLGIYAAVLGLHCLKAEPSTIPLRGVVQPPNITHTNVLSQNWSDQEALWFYNASQGSQMMPYSWFLHLEQADSAALYNDPANIRSLGYLPRVKDQAGNPDGLPVGFAKNRDGKGNEYVGLTCAACHTGQIHYQGTAWIVDGGPTMADAQTFMRTLEAALRATLNDAAKFNRFAQAILPTPVTDSAKSGLRNNLADVLGRRSSYNLRNLPAEPTRAHGPGRLDAFDAIFNEVAVRFAQVPNAPSQCDAPVSYPFLWDTPHHDRVQWNGSAENTVVLGNHIGALGRNIGEVLGVFADVDTTKKEFPLGGYSSSVQTDNLKKLEDTLSNLWSPKWPEDAFGKIDTQLAAKGGSLFKTHCANCHQDIKREDPKRKVIAQMAFVQTDLSMARNAAERKSPSGIFEGRHVFIPPLTNRKLGPVEPIAILLSHLGERVLIGPKDVQFTSELQFKFDIVADLDDGTTKLATVLSSAEIDSGVLRTANVKAASVLKTTSAVLQNGADLTGLPSKFAAKFKTVAGELGDMGDKLATFQGAADNPVKVIYKYKARPLNGIWATAPYLHNGSILNLDELLKPAKDRLKKFHTGTLEFDPKCVGFKNEGPFELDTTAQPGNSNVGHEYGAKVFTPDERAQLVEYMKQL